MTYKRSEETKRTKKAGKYSSKKFFSSLLYFFKKIIFTKNIFCSKKSFYAHTIQIIDTIYIVQKYFVGKTYLPFFVEYLINYPLFKVEKGGAYQTTFFIRERYRSLYVFNRKLEYIFSQTLFWSKLPLKKVQTRILLFPSEKWSKKLPLVCATFFFNFHPLNFVHIIFSLFFPSAQLSFLYWISLKNKKRREWSKKCCYKLHSTKISIFFLSLYFLDEKSATCVSSWACRESVSDSVSRKVENKT